VITNLSKVPSTPGVYQFFDSKEIIYIGKAKTLNKRVKSYFTKSIKDRKTQKIKEQAVRVETFSTHSEIEALILEQQLIKEYKPKFNILLRDDKTYPYIYFNSQHSFPSLELKRNKQAINENYYGPYVSAKFARQQIKDLQKIFKLRNCSDSTFANRSRPCIEFQMKRCSAPCVNKITNTQYLMDVESAKQFLTSERKQLKTTFKTKMEQHARSLNFEEAELFKQRIIALEKLEEDSTISSQPIDIDIIAHSCNSESTGVALVSVRGGRVQVTKTYYFKENLNDNLDELLQRICFGYYQHRSQIASKVLITARLKNKKILQEALSQRLNHKVRLVHSKNKHTLSFVALANLNAQQIIRNQSLGKETYGDHFTELLSHFSISENYPTLECIDISHHSGSFSKASVVHFSAKGKVKSNYRTYNIPKDLAGNDTGSIQFAVEKRFSKNKLPPLILLIDGGKPQLKAALRAKPNSAKTLILSVAKGANRKTLTETIYTSEGQIDIKQHSLSLKLLLSARDEAHRFAIKANRKAKTTSVKKSKLDEIKGIGSIRKTVLIKQFKSLENIKSASIEEIQSLPSFSANLARVILESLN